MEFIKIPDREIGEAAALLVEQMLTREDIPASVNDMGFEISGNQRRWAYCCFQLVLAAVGGDGAAVKWISTPTRLRSDHSSAIC